MHDPGIAVDFLGIEAADRRAEVHRVIAPPQAPRQLRAGEVDHDLRALLLQIDRRARIGQAHDQPAGAGLAATKVDARIARPTLAGGAAAWAGGGAGGIGGAAPRATAADQ